MQYSCVYTKLKNKQDLTTLFRDVYLGSKTRMKGEKTRWENMK